MQNNNKNMENDGYGYFESWEKSGGDGGQLGDGRNKHPGRDIYARFILENSSSVLDVGCGFCMDHPRFSSIQYSGVDVTHNFLVKAKSMFRANVVWGSATNLPFSDCLFDSVYESGMLEHLPPEMWRRVILEMFRVARKQVLLIFFVTPSKSKTTYQMAHYGTFWENEYGENDIVNYLKILGAERVEVVGPIVSQYPAYPPLTIIRATKK